MHLVPRRILMESSGRKVAQIKQLIQFLAGKKMLIILKLIDYAHTKHFWSRIFVYMSINPTFMSVEKHADTTKGSSMKSSFHTFVV